ncbi:S-layer domain protein [Peptoclostridium acidaminophilum DSM 3953]|uniref:S-layer domain protein n=1 Tax=Peptoclostridium acidaminophilum DSM 3953 TaxID=1286171 RepID=W8T368_PEPAC|nr:S-layer homology domain-containing protein [Peptoclostridium acidaminophilum]AHM56194.1 S-layer domain protein [Peptoclostridium acidaminophilum DSM 3953]
MKRFKSKLIGLVCASSLFFQPVFALEAADISGHWAEGEIRTWLEKGYAKGYESGEFKPDAPVTRAEFAAFMNRTLGLSDIKAVSFKDVAAGDWFYTDMLKANAAGYISGYEDNTVRPYARITRQEAALMIQRALNVQQSDYSKEAAGFSDYINIAEWAADAVGYCFKEGIIKGYTDGSFMPDRSVTRAEAIRMLDEGTKVRDRLREQEQEQEQQEQDQQEQEQEQNGIPESSTSHRAFYILEKWMSGGDAYVEFVEYGVDGTFSAKARNLEYSQIDEERPYVARIRSGEIEFVKPINSKPFDSIYGKVVEKSGNFIKLDTTPGSTDDDETFTNISLSGSTLVYEESSKNSAAAIGRGDFIWAITEDTIRARVVEMLTEDELENNRDNPPYTDGY